MLQHLNHELRVLGVIPVIDIGVQVRPLDALHILLLHSEVYLEEIDEVCEEESPVDVCLDMIGQLNHESHVDR